MSIRREIRSLPTCADQTGRSFGEEELALLREVIESGTLNCTRGTAVKRFEEAVAKRFGVPFARTTTSGTAAVHAAIAAVDPEPGDEIITTPITDMGAITPIIYQTAIPIFADVDPRTYNVTAETIAARITPRTKAVIVTHLFGQCCDMDPILALCHAKGIPVIEDAAQSMLGTYKGRLAGTIGDIGCFSLQQTKHITAGEGGFVMTRDDHYARRMRLFIDKAWPYGEPDPDHEFVALNYRMTELQGAVALGQFDKLERFVAQRRATAEALNAALAGIRGVEAPRVLPGIEHVYWRYALYIDDDVILGGADAMGAKLKDAGIFCAPRYTKKLAFECRVIRDHNTFGASKFPFEGPHMAGRPPVRYDVASTPGAVDALRHVVVVPWNEKTSHEDVAYIAAEVRRAAEELSR